MISIDDLIKRQEEFDKLFRSNNFHWDEKITDKNIAVLEYLLLATVGEIGEAVNLLKKVLRGDKTLIEIKEELSEEIIDTLIYVLKLIYQLDIDLERIYSKKMKKNEERFSRYRKDL